MKTISSKTLAKIMTACPTLTMEDIIDAARSLCDIKDRFPALTNKDIIEIARTMPED